MKRFVSVVLIIGMIVSVTSCVSQAQYDELEQRVASLESQVNATASSETDAIAGTSENATEAVESVSSNVWSLDGMTSDEIVNLIFDLTAIPEEGSSVDDYLVRIQASPEESYSASSFTFTDCYSDQTNDASNYIIYLSSGIDYNMDGTIHIPTDQYIAPQITLSFSDFETASSVYNALHDYVNDNYDVRSDSSEGTSWSMYISYLPYGVDPAYADYNNDWYEVLSMDHHTYRTDSDDRYYLVFTNFYIPY